MTKAKARAITDGEPSKSQLFAFWVRPLSEELVAEAGITLLSHVWLSPVAPCRGSSSSLDS